MPTFDGMKATKAWKPEKNEAYELATAGSVGVKLYRRQRRTPKGETRWIYEVVDHTQGHRRLRSFSDLAKARKDANRIAEQLATGKATAAQMSNAQAASFGRATELLKPTGLSLEVSAAIVAKSVEILGSDRIIEAVTYFHQHGADNITPRTVPEVVAELLAAKKARGMSARYLGDLKASLGRFAKQFQTDIASVSTPDVQHWLDGLKVKPNTARQFRTLLFLMFRFAESHGYIHKGGNPVAGVEQISAKSDGDIAIYTPKEIAELLKAASKDFRPVVAIGAFAGVRTAEIMRLEWRDVDLAGGYIHIAAGQAKTAQRRLVPITPNLAQWLAPYTKQRGHIWKGDRHEMEFARAATVKGAGVPWKHNALRHSFCSYRLADIQNAAQVALEAGNSPTMVFKHYRELVKPAAAKAYFGISPKTPANVLTMPEQKEAAQ